MILFVVACAQPQPPPPSWVQSSWELDAVLSSEAATVRTLVGLAGKDDAAACLGIRGAIQLAPRLDDHLRRVRTRSSDVALFDANTNRLPEAIPGLAVRQAEDGVRVGTDYLELARAVGAGPTADVLVTSGAFLSLTPVGWAGGCWNPDAAAPWLVRLGPAWNETNECLRDILIGPLTDAMGVASASACVGAQPDRAASALNKLEPFRGPTWAARLTATGQVTPEL